MNMLKSGNPKINHIINICRDLPAEILNGEDNQGNTILELACDKNYSDLVEVIYENGANIATVAFCRYVGENDDLDKLHWIELFIIIYLMIGIINIWN